MAFLPDAPVKTSSFVPDAPIKSSFVPDAQSSFVPDTPEEQRNPFFDSISRGIKSLTNTTPVRPPTLDEQGQIVPEIRQAPGLINRIKDTFQPSNVFPLTKAVQGIEIPNLPLGADLPLKGLQKLSAPVTGALDIFGTGINIARESAAGALGEDPAIGNLSRITRGLTTDRTAGSRVMDAEIDKVTPEIHQMVSAGKSEKEIIKKFKGRVAAKGFMAEAVEVGIIQSILSAPVALQNVAKQSNLIKRLEKAEAKLRDVNKLRKQKEVGESIARSAGQTPGQLALPSPTTAGRAPGPIQGKGFVMGDEAPVSLATPKPAGKGFPFKKPIRVESPGTRNVLEKVSRKPVKVKAPKRTPKDQLKDVRDVLLGVKSKGLGANLGNVGIDKAGKKAAQRLIKDANKAGKDLFTYLKEDLKVSDDDAQRLSKLLAVKTPKTFGQHVQKLEQRVSAEELAQSGVTETTIKEAVVNAKKLENGKRLPQFGRVAKEKGARAGNIVLDEPIVIDMPTKVMKNGQIVLEGGTKVGDFNIGKAVAQGSMTRQDAEMIVLAQRLNPVINFKLPRVSDPTRFKNVGSKEANNIIDILETMTPGQVASIADTPISTAVGIIERAKARGIPFESIADEVGNEVLRFNRVSNAAGLNLRAIGQSAGRKGLMSTLRESLKNKTGMTAADRRAVRKMLEDLGEPKKATFVDMIVEIGINNMLSALITFERNLVGSALGIGTQPLNKLGQATASSIARLVGAPQTERTFFREIAPELGAMFKAIPGKLRKSKEFFLHEDIRGVVNSLETKLGKLRDLKPPANATSKQLAKFRNDRLKKTKKVIRDIRDTLTEEELTRVGEEITGFKGRAIPGKLGAVINLPSKTLIATDKFFQGISAEGHGAAFKVRRAIQTGRSPKHIRLTRKEIEAAKNDALFYVFREKLSDKLTNNIQKFITKTPGAPLLFPFFKSRVNFIKFAFKESPFGLVDTLAKSVKGGALDTKSAGRALGGSAAILGIMTWLGKNKDVVELQAPSVSTAERDLRRNLKIGELALIFKDPKTGKKVSSYPLDNLNPLTFPIMAIALMDEYKDKVGKGGSKSKAFSDLANKAWRGLLEQSTFSDVKEMTRAADALVSAPAVTETGEPDPNTAAGSWGKFVSRFVSGKSIPNAFREARTTGKLWGVPISKPDLSIIEARQRKLFKVKGFQVTDLGILDEILASIPKIGKFDPAKNVPRREGAFGQISKRQPRIFPVGKTTGRAISDVARISFGLDPKGGGGQKISDDPVLRELNRVKVFPARAPAGTSIKKVPVKFTSEERRMFNFLGPKLREKLLRIIESDKYKSEISDVKRAERLEKEVRKFRSRQAKVLGTLGIDRLLQSEEGIRTIIEGRTKGRAIEPSFPPNLK